MFVARRLRGWVPSRETAWSRSSQRDGEPPAEVQFLEMPSQASLEAYVNDPRRLAMAVERDAAIARTDLFRIQRVSGRQHAP